MRGQTVETMNGDVVEKGGGVEELQMSPSQVWSVRCCRGTVWHLWGDGAGDGTVYRRRRGVPPANDNGAGHNGV